MLTGTFWDSTALWVPGSPLKFLLKLVSSPLYHSKSQLQCLGSASSLYFVALKKKIFPLPLKFCQGWRRNSSLLPSWLPTLSPQPPPPPYLCWPVVHKELSSFEDTKTGNYAPVLTKAKNLCANPSSYRFLQLSKTRALKNQVPGQDLWICLIISFANV